MPKPKPPELLTELRKSIQRRYDSRAEFFGNLVAFVILVGGVWTLGRPDPVSGWHTVAIVITLGWAAGLGVHFVNFLTTEGREKAIQTALVRYGAETADGMPERLVRLSEDGELVEVGYDDEPKAKRKRS